MPVQTPPRTRRRAEPVEHATPWQQYQWTPEDGMTYCLLIGPAPTPGTAAFVSIGRAGTPLIGAYLVLDPWPTFGAFVDAFAASSDMDVQLLWAGWRGLCALYGLPDPVPPAWLPPWRVDWAERFSAPALATA